MADKLGMHEIVTNVNSKESFLAFVEALAQDRIDEIEKEKIKPSNPSGAGTNGWQNTTIENFLESVHSFGQDSSEIKEEPTWKTFALLLLAGKMYE